ncbi:MAG: sulfur oxidation c-type cytochrome SoxA [Pseudomonadota bacterium]
MAKCFRSGALGIMGLAVTFSTLAQDYALPSGAPDALTGGTPAMRAPPMRSGYHYQSAEIRALQDDDFANPGMLWVDQGDALWRESGAADEPSCQSCHGEPSSLRGVAVRYPRYDESMGGLINLEGRINRCRQEHQKQPPLPYESEPLLALTALLAHQSRGMPISVSIEGPAREFFEQGKTYFYTRRGQLNLACYHCHELNPDRYLRGDRLSQGQPTGYPIYRLDWQTLGSLQRRLRFCNTGVRAEPHEFGDPTWLNLELFLGWRARGLLYETPAVRR